MTERTLFRELMAIREEELELPAILTYILGESLQDAHFDHYHFPRVHCVSVHVLHTDRQWLVNVCVYTNVLLSPDFLSICQGVYSRFIVLFFVPTGTYPHPIPDCLLSIYNQAAFVTAGYEPRVGVGGPTIVSAMGPAS